MRNGRLVLTLMLLLISGSTIALAQDAAPAADDDTQPGRPDAVERAGATLEEIAATLRTLASDQRALLIIRRIELEEARLAPARNALHQARDDVRSSREESEQLAGIAENLRTQIEDAVLRGSDPLQIPQKTELDQIETLLEIERRRLEVAELQVVEAENNIALGRLRMEILDDKLDAMLE